ncbi:MAG: TIGR02147 family protein [Fibrobacteres bacterium]|nr:TIGR02147 family protein [Fibrobacterota bacterium]
MQPASGDPLKGPSKGLESVFAYTDFRRYLRDFYTDRKGSTRRFSFRAFAQAAGFSSPNFIQLVMDGKKNLAGDSASRLAEAMGLTGEEAAHFLDLVRFAQAKDVETRSRALESLEARQRRDGPALLADDDAAYLAHWYLPVIRELAALPGFSEDPAWIARRLGFPVPAKDIRAALDFLERKGYLARVAANAKGAGRLVPKQATLATGGMEPGALARAARAYHLQMAELARQAIFKLPPDRRLIANTTLSLSAEGYAHALARIEALRAELLKRAEGDSAPAGLYQLNINLFPLTQEDAP